MKFDFKFHVLAENLMTYLAVENNGSGSRSVLEQSKDLVKAFFIRSLILVHRDPDGFNLGVLKQRKYVKDMHFNLNSE